ncbi:sodium/potassium/calcium exchanger 4 [Drosophila miranda]|uniref:sodium/potassium/calcium exchanger 4 n=1 Tax=Drosophila miranda TaxID=7229 RepID=UPI0007E75B33|nr:sodium/potassium/calcium exchanger 4 [Drosophila miranda]
MFFGGDADFQRLLRESGFDRSDLRSEDELNCTLPAILDFPNLMRKKSIGVALACFLISMYLFILLAIVCDDYLVPSMERLCYTLRMTYDVAGATFLAAATSAPELFVAFIGTFITEGDIGVGTIVGSSVFNVLGIATVCGIFTGVTAKLDWWPISRDTMWYLASISLLGIVLIDSKVMWYEAAIMLSLYFIYLTTLIFDRKLQGLCRSLDGERELMDEDPMLREEDPFKTFREHICSKPEKGSPCIEVTWWVIKYPSIFILAITTPSVRTIFFFTMLIAVIWISGISYLLSWFLTVVGYNIGIPDSIMGLTVLAVGTSVPEVVSSYIVTRKGYGSMAMCNAIGSNTFDIFICLGLPWLLKNLIKGQPIQINSTGLTITSAMLVATVVLLYAGFLLTKFTLGKPVGWMSLITYILFLVCAIAIEITQNKLNHCDIEDNAYTNYLHQNL